MLLRVIRFVPLPLMLCLLDRLTKSWAVQALAEVPIRISSFLNLDLSWNRGVTCSMFSNLDGNGFLILSLFVALIITAFFAYTVARYRIGKSIWFESMILSGAVSNLIDRFMYGAVVDFIDFHAFGYHWPTFNVADSCIVIGVFGILMVQVIYE